MSGLCSKKSTKSFINKVNEIQTNSKGVINFASFSAKDKGKMSLSLMASVPCLRTTKSFPDQIVSRYFSTLAEPLIENPGGKIFGYRNYKKKKIKCLELETEFKWTLMSKLYFYVKSGFKFINFDNWHWLKIKIWYNRKIWAASCTDIEGSY